MATTPRARNPKATPKSKPREHPPTRSKPLCEATDCRCPGCLDGYEVAPFRCRECRCIIGLADCKLCDLTTAVL